MTRTSAPTKDDAEKVVEAALWNEGFEYTYAAAETAVSALVKADYLKVREESDG